MKKYGIIVDDVLIESSIKEMHNLCDIKGEVQQLRRMYDNVKVVEVELYEVAQELWDDDYAAQLAETIQQESRVIYANFGIRG